MGDNQSYYLALDYAKTEQSNRKYQETQMRMLAEQEVAAIKKAKWDKRKKLAIRIVSIIGAVVWESITSILKTFRR